MAGFSFSSLFGGSPQGGIQHNGGGARVTPQPAVNPQGQLTSGAGDAVGAGGQPANNEPKPDPLNSHLEEMARVWQPATTADGKPLPPQADPLAQPLFQFKPDDVKKAASNLDFTSNLNPELVTKALGGDAAAFLECLNGVAQTAFTAQTLNMGNVLNDGFNRHGRAIDAALPTRLRNHAVATARSEDPILSSPALVPVIQTMKTFIAAQQPGLSPEQIQAAAENYVKGIGAAFNMKDSKQQETQQAKEETDWLAWANMNSEN